MKQGKRLIVLFLAAAVVLPWSGPAYGVTIDMDATYEKVVQAIEDYADPYTGKNALANYSGGKARQCHAFVNYVWKNVFGYDVYSAQCSTTPKSTDYANLGNYIQTYARPGDILRVEGKHSFVITEINAGSVTGYDWLYTTKEGKRTYTWAQIKNWGSGSQVYYLYQLDLSVYRERYGVHWTAPVPDSQAEGNVVALQMDNPLMSVQGIGLLIDEQGTSPLILDGRMLIPARAVAEAMGGEI
ncbi:MAG: hypothetical protein Q4C22_07970, partial [Bacillota bacterium]|nr:hypothetical protein [Bacillota bacterium]